MSQSNKLEEDSYHNPRVTWEGCSVLIDINDGDRLVFARLTAGSTLTIGNKKYPLQPLIGCPFGSWFQVENGKEGQYLSRVLPTSEGDNVVEKGDCRIKDESKDNRALVDNNTAQSLSGEDIDSMRSLLRGVRLNCVSALQEQEGYINVKLNTPLEAPAFMGATGDEIVQALIANSATFEKKTSFSQEKYRLKKQKKYAPKVLLRRPFTRSICETYFKKYPARIGFLRVDTLSLLLSMGNVGAHSDVLVVDMVGGILTGAVAERLGGTGYVCNTYLGLTPYPVDIVRMFNFSSETCRRIVQCSLTDLCCSQNGTCVPVSQSGEPCNIGSQSQEEKSSMCSVSMDECAISSESGMLDLVAETSTSSVTKASKTPKPGEKASQEAISFWKENGFSSLIIAAPDVDAWSIVKELLPFLSFSAPFAIYHQYIQPLATCMHNLQLGKMAVGLQISEPWLREYQVLPSRTHPHMQMSAFGGYILSGTKIRIEDQLQPK